MLVESIPKMLDLKKFYLKIDLLDGRIFDMVGQCIGLHQGEIVKNGHLGLLLLL